MEFKINPSAYSNMFPVPAALVDDNIRLASSCQLKTLLYFFRRTMMGESVAAQQIADALLLEKDDVDDALIFWRERGILVKSGEEIEAVPAVSQAQQGNQPQAEAKPEPETKPAKAVAAIPISKPSLEQIAARVKECEQFRDLFAEAQMKLGKTIGYDGQSVLVMLHDSYGLSFEVILMLLEYAKSQGKTAYSYIARLGQKWSEMEIDTIEQAEQYIIEQTGTNALWREFRELSGVKNENPTVKQRRFFNVWRAEYGFNAEMIFTAYEISIDNTEKMSLEYMDRVLKGWYDNGVKSPMDVKKEQDKWKQAKMGGKAGKGKAAQKTASYDLDAFTKKSIGLKYKKNNS